MYFIYNLIVKISWFILRIVAVFNSKIKLFVEGRKESFNIIERKISKIEKTIWVHAASLGEFEQGLPIIEKLKEKYADCKIVVTFFSPSGYEVKKNTPIADVVCYLPIDTRRNAREFIQKINPKIAIFIKYEIWPNYLKALADQNIPALLVSAIFNKDQIYFKWYGSFMRNALKRFSHYFVQDSKSESLLESIKIQNVSISGDTRLDRVSKILDQDNSLDFMESFKSNKLCFIAGSTWPEDEEILIDYINNTPKNLKYVLAPHTIKKDKILGLAGSLTKKTVLYSNRAERDLNDFDVLIIDHIGLLTKIYSYADIAYVGGGFATGLHNTLEPAVFGIPVIIGPNYKGFNEAEDLVAQKGILPIHDKWSFSELMKKLIKNEDSRHRTGSINSIYISKNRGATDRITNYIENNFQ
ncbi:glycosyltransferase N-terminal domain-containing protein [Pseudozobellia sp. WGM2]|uniref:3-deoxy-D-manno-octulosonic acid transferase n=1 Tax=Pseudozobellia sp. WGM2 TaxID=2787625 RepID=UPI001AE0C52B